MSLKMKTKSGGGTFEQPEPGNQAAVLVAIVELGTVLKQWTGKPKSTHEVYLVWELTTQQMTGSTFNHVIGKSYTASLDEKANLRKMIEKWRGKIPNGQDFLWQQLLGKPCLLDVQATEDGKFTRLDALCATQWGTGVTKGQKCPSAKRTPVFWEIDDAEHLPEHLDWLPFLYGESVQDRIARSDEWKAKKSAQRNGDEKPVDELADEPQADDPF